MVRECQRCLKKSDDCKRCAACHKVWYCGQPCQQRDWVEHIFDCKPRRPITTADHLALAVERNLFPDDPQTCEDYGFMKAFTANNRSMLLGVYIGLIERMGIKAKTLHQWRINGTLVQEIKAAFNKLPEGSRGGYYPWFLKNQHMLEGPSEPHNQAAYIDESLRRSWRFTGGSASYDAEQIKREMAAMPKDKQTCHHFAHLLSNSWHPAPGAEFWIQFGFCTCRNVEEEMELARCYKSLILQCSFDEFCTAYSSSSLFKFFHSKGIKPNIPHLEDVLQRGSMAGISVWDLKSFVLQEVKSDGTSPRPIPAVTVDYGFMNCRKQEKMTDLKKVYARYFERHDGDPIQLHEAAMQGRLFKHIESLFTLKKKFKLLMQNPYPLPE